jgi:hypothetical protein
MLLCKAFSCGITGRVSIHALNFTVKLKRSMKIRSYISFLNFSDIRSVALIVRSPGFDTSGKSSFED